MALEQPVEYKAPKYMRLLISGDGRPFNSQYAILEKTHADAYKVIMENVGNADHARLVLEALYRKDDESKRSAEKAEEEWQEKLAAPHAYISPSSKSLVCYCGKPMEDEIHISEEEEEARRLAG